MPLGNCGTYTRLVLDPFLTTQRKPVYGYSQISRSLLIEISITASLDGFACQSPSPSWASSVLVLLNHILGFVVVGRYQVWAHPNSAHSNIRS